MNNPWTVGIVGAVIVFLFVCAAAEWKREFYD